MIKSFRHKGLEAFFKTGKRTGIQPAHVKRLRLQLAKLDTAKTANDMNLPGWRLHPLKGSFKGYWAVWVDKNWRVIFTFDGGHAVFVDYQDYH